MPIHPYTTCTGSVLYTTLSCDKKLIITYVCTTFDVSMCACVYLSNVQLITFRQHSDKHFHTGQLYQKKVNFWPNFIIGTKLIVMTSPSLIPRPFLRGGGERAWYTLIAHVLSIIQNLGDRIRIGYLPRNPVFQYVNHRTSR